ncbi:hypothetical protein [Pseudooceanicola sp.]|uniref:hypothetical protein n=2 Tax=Pseudooceanicola sp. TaxID=1914328 RepID=UPI0035C6EF46
MHEEYSHLAAEIIKWPSKAELVLMFEADGYAVTEGRYSVRLKDFDHFAFRELGGDISQGCITADHTSTEELIAFSTRVSKTLSKAGVKHRFEIYNEKEELAAYLHYDWPQN